MIDSNQVVRTQLQDMGEPHIGSMGFRYGVYMALGCSTTTASLCGVVLPRFVLIGIKDFHHVWLQMSGAGGNAGIAMFA